MIDLRALLQRMPNDTAKTLVEQARMTTPGLSETIYQGMLEGEPGDPGVMAPPIIEGAFPWKPDPNGWSAADKIFRPSTVNLLKEVSFPPYVHQAEAWSILRKPDPRSVIVSSGTGSGKTECFLSPLVDHLLSLSHDGGSKLSGVRAIMLYPLNALINSQEDRLSEWLRPFNGNIRYCLYNGATPNQMKAGNWTGGPEKVPDRVTLRADPPPILVTNITMLEYMLVRREDAAILNRSKGKLDYIILDEAHTYIGAQAAELSLLLRRVAAAFGKKTSEIRFVATSATIGDGDANGLRQFLADLAGVPESQVDVVQGERAPIQRLGDASAGVSRSELQCEPVDQFRDRLFENGDLSQTRLQLQSDKPMDWAAWKTQAAKIMGVDRASDEDALLLLSRCVETRDLDTGETLFPCRLHLFHRTMPGVWVCPSKQCPGRPHDVEEWHFGAVFRSETEHCSHCGSVTFEWVSCRACGDGALLAEESELADRLQKVVASAQADDFLQELTDEEDREEEDAESTPKSLNRAQRYLLHKSQNGTETVLDAKTGKILDAPREGSLSLYAVADLQRCPHCQEKPPSGSGEAALRAIRAGAPYLVRQVVPTVLPLLSARSQSTGLPMAGRSMITFTDARQGTAKHSQTLQLAAEREFVRGFLYHAVQSTGGGNFQEIEKINKKLERFRSLPAEQQKMFQEDIDELEQELASLSGGTTTKPIEELISELASNSDVRGTLLDLWSARSESIDSAEALAEFLLLRELARRPKWAASGETLGLYRVVLPPKLRPLPAGAERHGISRNDWETLLELFVTHFLRQNQMIVVRRPAWMRYAGIKGGGRFLVKSAGEVMNRNTQKAWPSAHAAQAGRTALISLLSQTLGLPLDDRQSRDSLEVVLAAAFQAMTSAGVLKQEPDGWRLDWTKLHLSKVQAAEICPITRLPLQGSFKGRTIYSNSDGVHLPVSFAEYPELPYPNRRTEEGDQVSAKEFDKWLQNDELIVKLREQSLWDNRTDRAVRLEGYYRSAEHSAQISQTDLQKYEASFKAGKINILNCSTTMEMGVDIGDVEAVLLTNAPPAISNYKQRVGRAGRRDQSISLGITICKNTPLDRSVADNPIAYLTSKQPVPRVSLESALIAQRHVNAWLLAKFFSEGSDELLKLTVGNFFGLGTSEEAPPYQAYVAWIDENLGTLAVEDELSALVYQTPLPHSSLPIEASRESLIEIASAVRSEWEALGGGASAEDNALAKAQKAQRSRVEGEYLLSALSGYNFLPAYGFPTGVVQFWTETSEERSRREAETGPTSFEDRRFISRGMPSRQRNIAIHEYAPGSEIVIDGLLRKSAGVTLNWQRPVSDDDLREVQSLRTVRFCENCGTLRSSAAVIEDDGCPACGSTRQKDYPYLSPAGFTVDARAKVSDRTDGTAYSERPQALVAAVSGEWRSLPDPEVGQFRTSPDGLVFERNAGPNGFGYAICLECGRAEAESEEAPASPPPGMVDHKPLRWTPNAGQNEICPGANRSFSLQRNLNLGDEIRTGVLELQLTGVTSQETAITVAMALREVAARRLGIEPGEMGISAVQTRDQDNIARWTATLYDRTSGGAGFATQAGEHIVEIIRSAAAQLDCSAPGRCGDDAAQRICPKCVLRTDVQSFYRKSDRASAYSVLKHAANKLALPEEVQIFGPDSTYVPEAIQDVARIKLERAPSASLYARLDGPPSDWDLDNWNLRQTIQRFTARDGKVGLIVDLDALKASATDVRLEIAMWSVRHGVSLYDHSAVSWPEHTCLLIDQESSSHLYGAAEQTLLPSANWGSSADAPLVSKTVSDWSSPTVDFNIAEWVGSDAPTPVRFLNKELDGDIRTFGRRFRHILGQLAPDLAADCDLKFKEIRVSDRYIYSPVAVRIYAELLGSLADRETHLLVRTLGAKRNPDHRTPYLIWHDWHSVDRRDEVFRRMLEGCVSSVRIETSQSVPHGRTIDLVAQDGRTFTIILDQGVGYWRANKKLDFDFFKSPTAQAQRLENLPISLIGDHGGSYIAVIPPS